MHTHTYINTHLCTYNLINKYNTPIIHSYTFIIQGGKRERERKNLRSGMRGLGHGSHMWRLKCANGDRTGDRRLAGEITEKDGLSLRLAGGEGERAQPGEEESSRLLS